MPGCGPRSLQIREHAQVTFGNPAGWATEEGFVTKNPEGEPIISNSGGDNVLLVTWIVTHVYADTCDWEGTMVDLAGTVGRRFSLPTAGNESGGLCCAPAGSTDVVYVVDFDGNTFAVVARHTAASSAQDRAELEAIVASIRIDSPGSTSSTSS